MKRRKLLLVFVVLVLLVSLVLSGCTTDYSVQIEDMNKQITSANNQVTALKLQVDALPVASLVSALSARVGTTETSLADIKQQVTTLNNSGITSVQSKINDITNQLAILTKNIASLQADVKAIVDTGMVSKADFAVLQTQVATLKTQVAALVPVVPTTVVGGTSQNGMTVSITGNPYFQNKSIFPFPDMPVSVVAVPPALSVTNATMQQITFQVTNVSKTAISSVQLAIGLTLYSGDGTLIFTLPSDASVSLSSSLGYGILWKSVATGQSNMLGFQTNVSAGVFANSISLAVGETKQFTVNVTVTAGKVNAISSFLMSVQVIPLPSI